MSHSKRYNTDAMILNLIEIENLLRSTNSIEKELFLSNFGTWANQRSFTLSELRRLKAELNDVCINAKIGKCIGTGASIVGGLATLFGLGLQLSSDEGTRSTGKKIAGYGAGAGLLGAATSAGSSGVEYVVNKKLLKEVKSALEKDKELTRLLVPFLKRSEDLSSLFKQVFDCDILSDTVKDIFAVVQGIRSLYQQGKYAYDEISEAFSSSVNDCYWCPELQNIEKIFRSLGKRAQYVLLEFCENRKVRDAVLKIEQAITNSPIIWDISKMSIKVFFKMFGISKEQGYLSLITNFAGVASKQANILLKTVSLAFDIVNFIANVKDITDSESKYSEAVEKIELFLMRELNEANGLVNQYRRNPF